MSETREGFWYLPNEGRSVPYRVTGEFDERPRFEDLPTLLKSFSVLGVKDEDSETGYTYTFSFDAPKRPTKYYLSFPERRKFRRYRRNR